MINNTLIFFSKPVRTACSSSCFGGNMSYSNISFLDQSCCGNFAIIFFSPDKIANLSKLNGALFDSFLLSLKPKDPKIEEKHHYSSSAISNLKTISLIRHAKLSMGLIIPHNRTSDQVSFSSNFHLSIYFK